MTHKLELFAAYASGYCVCPCKAAIVSLSFLGLKTKGPLHGPMQQYLLTLQSINTKKLQCFQHLY